MRKKTKAWTEDEWHAVDSAVGFLQWKTINKISEETGIDDKVVRLIIEDTMNNDPTLIIKRGKSYKYFHAADCYDE